MKQREFFRRENRLKTPSEFKAVYRNGASFAKKPLILKALHTSTKHTRVGFSISAKIVRRSVDRTRVRRVLREAFRKNTRFLKEGFDMVFVVRPAPDKHFCYDNAKDLMLELAHQAGILKEHVGDEPSE